MHHAVTIEGVVAVLWLMNRVGTVAEVRTEQVFGYFTLDLQARLAQLERGRCVDAMQIGIIEGVDPGLGVLKLGHPANTAIRHGVRGQVQGLVHLRLPQLGYRLLGRQTSRENPSFATR